MGLISKDIPLSEITLRKYEPPRYNNKRELVRKLCLSLGLLQPGDSRDVIVDVFQVLLEAKEPLSSVEIEHKVIDKREKNNLLMLGVAPSNIRRQLLRLRDLMIVEKKKNKYQLNYQIREYGSLKEFFKKQIKPFFIEQIINRVLDYLAKTDEEFNLILDEGNKNINKVIDKDKLNKN